LPTENLGDNEAWPFRYDGVDEIVIRVIRYKDDGVTPGAYQAVVRGRDRTKPWGVGIMGNPVEAILRAIESFFSPNPSPQTNAEISADEHAIRTGQYRPAETDPEEPEIDIEDLLS